MDTQNAHAQTPPSSDWHSLEIGETAERLGSDIQGGLTLSQVEDRLRRHGPNQLPQAPGKPVWRMIVEQFQSLLTLVLLAAGVLAGVIGDTTDMVVILAVTMFNAALGFHQEYRAERILEALKAMLTPQCRVRREGVKQEIAADQVVPGDLILLGAGDRIPADGRLVAAHALEIDESVLTGESTASRKQHEIPNDSDAVLADRSAMAFMNTVVTRGRGEMLVTATGAKTEMGNIAGLLNATSPGQTPLQERLDHLGRRLAMIAGAVVVLFLVLGVARGTPLSETILTAVALAVAAIPEGLPAVVTVTLAIGMARMARRGAIVKRLAAVETLGSTSVICSDKTGTLTLNRMTALAGWAGGSRFRIDDGLHKTDDTGPTDWTSLLRAAVLCNDSRLNEDGTVIGDATEGALLTLAPHLPNLAAWPRVAEIPFESERKLMVTLHRDPEGRLRMMVKGAPDIVGELCSLVYDETGPRPLDQEQWTRLRLENGFLADQALRVLALAERVVPPDQEARALSDPLAATRDLTLTALIGLMDPPRPSAGDAVAACHAAGIAIKMITGDHRSTAAAIARSIGLSGDIITGAELDRLDDATLAERMESLAVFARVAPEHKVRIVSALQAKGHVVAMTGDGVNDAPALRRADIGIAMGRTGTDVTREAATMVLTDDDFSTIVRAVAEGRTIYDNIVKFVRFQLSTNIGALLAVLTAPFFGLPIPFNPIQILWVNIIMDGPPAMALAFDPIRPGLMRASPRPRATPILSWERLGRLSAYGLTMAAGTLAVLAWSLDRTAEPERAGTLAFTTFVLFQVFNVFNARVGTGSAFNRTTLANSKLWLALAGIVGLQIVAVTLPPAQTLFHTTTLSVEEWILSVAVASSVLFLDEARKGLARAIRHLRRTG